MKLTEAQLKAIVAEEVQAAIEEGLFGAIGGAARGLAGVAGKAAGAVGRAAGAVGDKAQSALDRGLSAVGRGSDAVGKAAAAGIEKVRAAGAEVLDSAEMGSLQADVQKTVTMAKTATRKLQGAASRAQGNEKFAALLGGFASELSALATAAQKAQREAGRSSAYVRDPDQYRADLQAGKIDLDETASSIAESIVRRITKESKRRR
jgi:hypothetical protein